MWGWLLAVCGVSVALAPFLGTEAVFAGGNAATSTLALIFRAVTGSANIVLALLSLIGFAPLRNIGLLMFVGNVVSSLLFYQHRDVLAQVVDWSSWLGPISHAAQMLFALVAFLSAPRPRPPFGRKSLPALLLMLAILGTHGFALVADSQHLTLPPFLRDGKAIAGQLKPAEAFLQLVAGLAHLSGALGVVLGLVGLIDLRTSALAAFVPQVLWAGSMFVFRKQYEAVVNPDVLGFNAILGIHVALAVVSLLLYIVVRPPARRPKNA